MIHSQFRFYVKTEIYSRFSLSPKATPDPISLLLQLIQATWYVYSKALYVKFPLTAETCVSNFDCFVVYRQLLAFPIKQKCGCIDSFHHHFYFCSKSPVKNAFRLDLICDKNP